MTQLQIYPYCLRLRRPIRGVLQRAGWHLVLQGPAGRAGLGDAACWPQFGAGTAAVQAELVGLPERLTAMSLPSTLAAVPAFVAAAAVAPELRYALELACLDLLAQASGCSIAQLLAPAPAAKVRLHALVDSASAAQQAVRDGATAVKLKLEGASLADDLARAGAVRAGIGPAVGLRLDLNGRWSRIQGERGLRLLAAVAPEWVEQPLAAADIDGMATLRRLGYAPIAADESVYDAASLDAVLAASAADWVVLKPMYLGGLLAARALHETARAAGVRTIVTHALESAVGRLGALHLAAALSGPAATHGLAGDFAGDADLGPAATGWQLALPLVPGLGLTHSALAQEARLPC